MKKIMGYRVAFLLAGIIFVNLETAELAVKDLMVLPAVGELSEAEKKITPAPLSEMNRVGETWPAGYREIITSVDDVVDSAFRDIQNKNDAIKEVMYREIATVNNAIMSAAHILEEKNPKNPLIGTYGQLSQTRISLYNVQVALVQLEHTQAVITDLTEKNAEAGGKLAAKYPSLDARIINTREQFLQAQGEVDKIMKELSEKGEDQALSAIAMARMQMKNLNDQAIRKIRIRQYSNLMGLLELLGQVTQDIPGALAALKDVKATETRLHQVDEEINQLETTLGVRSQFQSARGHREDLGFTKLEDLKKQYTALREQYTKQIKAKHGRVLGKMILTKENIFKWVKTHPAETAAYIIGAVVLVGFLSAVFLPVVFMDNPHKRRTSTTPAAPASTTQNSLSVVPATTPQTSAPAAPGSYTTPAQQMMVNPTPAAPPVALPSNY